MDDASGGGLGREAVDGLQPNHFVAHRFDDSPATGGGACGHGEGAAHDHPSWNFFEDGCVEEGGPFRQVVKGAGFCRGEQCEGDDAHGFLGIV